MTPAKDQVRIAAAGQAAEWFIANQDPAPDHSQRAAFVAWLKSSPIHIEEYLGIALVARDLRMAIEETGESLESLLETARADVADRVVPMHSPTAREPLPQYGTPRHRWAFAAAAIVAAVSAAWWMNASHYGPEVRHFGTRHGEQTMQRLVDGSILHLNTDTAVEVVFDRSSRNVHMETGEALFTVVHGDAREFRVEAGAAEIIAVGTRFNVRLRPGSTVVTVVEGQVIVRAEPRAGSDAPDTMRVSAGYRLQIDGGVMAAQSEPVDTGAAVAWLQHKIAFDNQPLGEVADEFNRYGNVQIVIDDFDLRALPVSGVFNAYDTNSFAGFLESLDGVRVDRTAERIHVTRQDAANPREAPKAN